MSSFPRLHKRRLKRHLLRNRTQRYTAIRVRVMPSLVIMGRITTPPRLTLPTVGRANFYINNCSDLRWLQPFRTTGASSPSARTAFSARYSKPRSNCGARITHSAIILCKLFGEWRSSDEVCEIWRCEPLNVSNAKIPKNVVNRRHRFLTNDIAKASFKFVLECQPRKCG